MIALKKYNTKFEEDYFEIVDSYINDKLKKQIIESCKRYMPKNYFDTVDDEFKYLILLPYSELKKLYEYINKYTISNMEEECFRKPVVDKKFKSKYKELHDLYEKVVKSKRNNVKTNVRIVRENHIFTCPYCNRDYINSRGNLVSGAQLDHFYNRSDYPVFSLCLYNLVPVCGNCNRVKSNKIEEIISPFDESIDFSSSLYFDYEFDINNQIVVSIVGSNGLEQNIKTMKLKEAYEIHDIDVKDLIDKAEIYNKTQKEEILETFRSQNVTFTSNNFKKLIFGTFIKPEEFGKKPLSKLKNNILKKLNII